MRSTVLAFAAAAFLAGCSMMPFGEDEEKPTAAAAPADGAVPLAITTTRSADPADVYEIKDATRGVVRRVKVLLNGRTVDTLVMSRSRTEASSYCCTADGCEEVEEPKACTAFKMTCDVKGACKSLAPAAGGASKT